MFNRHTFHKAFKRISSNGFETFFQSSYFKLGLKFFEKFVKN